MRIIFTCEKLNPTTVYLWAVYADTMNFSCLEDSFKTIL